MSVGTTCGEICEFPMTIGLHLGSTLSPYLFTLIMDELTTHIQEVSWCMLFTDYIVLVDESRDGVNVKLKRWRKALKYGVQKQSIWIATSMSIYKELKLVWQLKPKRYYKEIHSINLARYLNRMERLMKMSNIG